MFRSTVSEICETVAALGKDSRADNFDTPPDRACSFVLSCFPAMPKVLALGVRTFTIAFAVAGIRYGGRPFYANPLDARARQWRRWRAHRFGPCRDLVRFYESLVSLALYSGTSARGGPA